MNLKINNTGQLTHMVAKDLFTETKKHVFSAKTGKWLGTIDTASQFNFEPDEKCGVQQEPVDQQINPAQLILF